MARFGIVEGWVALTHLRPALSTVGLPHCEMGRWAVGHLIERAEHGRATPTRHAIRCPYVERESV